MMLYESSESTWDNFGKFNIIPTWKEFNKIM